MGQGGWTVDALDSITLPDGATGDEARTFIGPDDPIAVAAFQQTAIVQYFAAAYAFLLSVEQFGNPPDIGQWHLWVGDTSGFFHAQFIDCEYDVDLGLSSMHLGITVDLLRISATGNEVQLQGSVTVEDEFFMDIDTWHKPTLVNGWTNAGGRAAFQYRKTPTSDHIQIVGNIVPGTLADNTVITTLPVGFRPTHAMPIICRDVANGVCSLELQTNGEVRCFDVVAGSTLVQIYPIVIPLDTT